MKWLLCSKYTQLLHFSIIFSSISVPQQKRSLQLSGTVRWKKLSQHSALGPLGKKSKASLNTWKNSSRLSWICRWLSTTCVVICATIAKDRDLLTETWQSTARHTPSKEQQSQADQPPTEGRIFLSHLILCSADPGSAKWIYSFAVYSSDNIIRPPSLSSGL